ncbi:hypothetical protein [Flavobacterium sp.]|jgi:hypothetical protein|uniref:hypothetical protein n=1 Tax=Flavobacterium sp. TaxID=239 RepID=UPI0037BE3D3D
MKHIFTKTFSRRTKQGFISIRKATSIKVYEDETNQQWIPFTDLEVIKYNRAKKIRLFFETYSCRERYSLIEYVIDHYDNDKLDRFFFALKKALKENGSELLGFIRLVDIGESGGVHHHIVVSIPKINVKGKELPKHLKRTFNGRKVHGEFVKNINKIMNYYIPKEIVELGIRKRTFVRSQKFKEIKANFLNNIHNTSLKQIIKY